MSGEKIAIVTSGGGMMCAYSAGALQALAERNLQPDIVIGTSGSSTNLAYFAAGQAHLLRTFWLDYACTEKFISGVKVNLSYMADEVLADKLPLDLDALRASPTKFFVSATDVDTGLPSYFSDDDQEILNAMRASVSLPVLIDPVRINGRLYADGAIGSPVWRTVQEAISKGATKVIVIDNSHKETLLIRILAWRFPKALRKAILDAYMEPGTWDVPDGVEVVRISPRRSLPVGVFTTDKKRVSQAMHMGYEDILHDKRLQALLTPSYTPVQIAPLSSSLSSPR